MADPTDPPFYRYAAKFLAALAAAVVGAGAVILAAADDGHVTPKEWAAIVLAVLAGVGGPAAVYAVKNTTKPDPVLPADFVDRAIFRRHTNGTVDIVWPSGRGTTWISPELLEGIVQTHNELVAHDGSAAAARAFPPATAGGPPWEPPDGAA